MEKNNHNGGKPSRLGMKLHNEIERIKDDKLKNGTVNFRLSTEKITNLIASHNYWKDIAKDIIKADMEEVNLHVK